MIFNDDNFRSNLLDIFGRKRKQRNKTVYIINFDILNKRIDRLESMLASIEKMLCRVSSESSKENNLNSKRL